ncbi:MAG: VTT domain-containing protein [Polyangia bacterium]|jgi:membrane-associated protein
MELLRQFLHLIRNPEDLIAQAIATGYPLLVMMAIIFAETGAMIFFLPGDSLLVTAGVFAANPKYGLSLLQMNVALSLMAILGDALSYSIGKKTGPALFSRPKSRLFNPEHIRQAHAFYEKHGGKTIIIARFMPILRTFVPVVAGIGAMTYRRFALYNVIGAVSWVVSMTLLGFFLGSLFPSIPKRIELVIIVVVFLSILPAVIAFARMKLGKQGGDSDARVP